MNARIHRLSIAACSATALVAVGCASNKSASKEPGADEGTRVALNDLSPAARATAQRVTTGGHIEKITRETERGRQVYDVEATIGGRHNEFLIADNTGEVLGTEIPVDFASLPAPVRSAAEQYFGTTTGLKAMKGVEYGETSYEVEGTRGGKTVEVTFDPMGKEVK